MAKKLLLEKLSSMHFMEQENIFYSSHPKINLQCQSKPDHTIVLAFSKKSFGIMAVASQLIYVLSYSRPYKGKQMVQIQNYSTACLTQHC